MSDLSSDARELLREGRAAFTPRPERLRAVRESLAVTLAANASIGLAAHADASAAGTASSAAKGSFLGSAMAKIGLASLIAVSSISGYVSSRSQPAERPHAVVPATAMAPAQASPAPGASAQAPFRSPASVSDAADPAPRRKLAGANRATVRSPSAESTLSEEREQPGSPVEPAESAPYGAQTAPALAPGERAQAAAVTLPAPPDTLALEAALIGRARAALARGDGSAALQILSAHEERFPRGILHEERSAMRARALCELGQLSAAQAEIRRLAVLAPRSPHLGQLEHACARSSEER